MPQGKKTDEVEAKRTVGTPVPTHASSTAKAVPLLPPEKAFLSVGAADTYTKPSPMQGKVAAEWLTDEVITHAAGKLHPYSRRKALHPPYITKKPAKKQAF